MKQIYENTLFAAGLSLLIAIGMLAAYVLPVAAGSDQHQLETENRDLFVANPSKYAPQYGGFCQMAAALGKKLDGDPSVWRVDGDMLFVYAYPAAKDVFVQDIAGNTQKADTNWPVIKGKVPKDR